MAKRRRHGKRKHRTGSIITTRKLNGLGSLKQPASFTGAFVPPLVGGAVAGGTSLAMDYMASSSVAGLGRGTHLNGVEGAWMSDWAPAIGLGAAGLVSVGLMMLAGTPQALASFASAATVSGTLFAQKYMASSGSAATAGVAGRGRMRARLGAMVAEQMQGLPARGTGAIVMEQSGAAQGYNRYSGGETVKLGAVNSGAFGTSAFNV